MLSPNLLPEDGILCIDPFYMDASEASSLFERMRNETKWSQKSIYIYGRDVLQPRLMAWYSDPGVSYEYSGLRLTAQPWPDYLSQIRRKIEMDFELRFNSVLLNLYRNGLDYMGFHADDEKELGPQPVIVSVSLGVTRSFHLRHRTKKHLKLDLELAHGSLLIMAGDMQSHWLHSLPRRKKIADARINLTFRMIRK